MAGRPVATKALLAAKGSKKLMIEKGGLSAADRALEATPWMWTLAFGHHEDARLRGHARGRDGGIR
jgi:hypothetical protein